MSPSRSPSGDVPGWGGFGSRWEWVQMMDAPAGRFSSKKGGTLARSTFPVMESISETLPGVVSGRYDAWGELGAQLQKRWPSWNHRSLASGSEVSPIRKARFPAKIASLPTGVSESHPCVNPQYPPGSSCFVCGAEDHLRNDFQPSSLS